MTMTAFDLPPDVASYLRNVHIKNVGERDTTLWYNSVPYIVRAGSSTTVPFECVCVWLGDPRAGDTAQVLPTNGEKMYVPKREDEVVRLRQLYGMHALGGSHELKTGDDPETGAFIDYPRIEVTSANGDRLYTVLEDPTGTQANGVLPSPVVARHDQTTNEIIERMQREIEMLKERQVREDSGLAPGHQPYEPLSESDLPRDEAPDPTAAPLPRGKSDKLDYEGAQWVAKDHADD